jgi:thiamine-phosphate pyrophosphorylase
LARVARVAPHRGPGFAVQLRDPGLSARELLDLGVQLRDATRAAGAKLVVNDRLDLALAIGADGLHLGRRSMRVGDARAVAPDLWISVSCHAVEEVPVAAQAGADAVLLSPVFVSPGKGPPLGIEGLASARAIAPRGLQILALGGVTTSNAAACFAAGASGVAAIRADLTSLFDRPPWAEAPSTL